MVERGRDVNDALVDFFEPIEFAASSEYRIENLKNKLGKECLMFYDRVISSGVAAVMPRCRIDSRPKNALGQLSKMIKISQVAAAAFEESDFPHGFRNTVELLFVRMKMGITEEGIAVRSLQKDEIPAIIGIVKLVRHLLEKFHFSGKAEAKVLANFESPISWLHRDDISHEALMVVRSSCKAMHAFITALYEGKWDHVFHEMADNGWRKKSVAGLGSRPGQLSEVSFA